MCEVQRPYEGNSVGLCLIHVAMSQYANQNIRHLCYPSNCPQAPLQSFPHSISKHSSEHPHCRSDLILDSLDS